MQRFQFSLERVLDWRRVAAEAEKHRLTRLLGERAAIDQDRERLINARAAAERAVLVPHQGYVEAADLAALDAFQRHTTAARSALGDRRSDCENRIRQQQVKVVEARRRAELLEKLKRRRQAEWRLASNRAEQAEAEDVDLARRNARRTMEPRMNAARRSRNQDQEE